MKVKNKMIYEVLQFLETFKNKMNLNKKLDLIVNNFLKRMKKKMIEYNNLLY